MADDLFGLAQGPLAEAPLPAPAPPTPPQPQKQGWKQLGPLAALIPLAMKSGGMPAVSALLAGMQQGRAQQGQQAQQGYQNARQSWMDQNTVQAQQEQAKARADAASAQQLQAQRQLLQDALTRAQELTDPSQVGPFLDMYPGIDRTAAATYIGGLLTPDAREKKAVSKFLKSLESDKTMSPDQLAYMEQHGSGFRVPGVDRLLTLPEMRAISYGSAVDQSGAPAMAPPKQEKSTSPSLGSFEDYIVRWAKGQNKPVESLTNVDIEAARKAYNQSDDRPRITVQGPKDLTPTARANVVGARRNTWTRFTKSIIDRQQAVAKVDAGLSALDRGDRNAATQIIIMAFNKLQDETSVVREGEYARSEDLAPIVSRVEAALTRLTQGGGGLTNEALRSLANEAKNTANALARVSNDAAANLRQGIEEELKDYQIPPSRVFGNSTIGVRSASPSPQTPPANDAPPQKPRIRYDTNGRPIG